MLDQGLKLGSGEELGILSEHAGESVRGWASLVDGVEACRPRVTIQPEGFSNSSMRGCYGA